MSARVRIDRVEVLVRGGSADAARALAQELPGALGAQLRRRPAAARLNRVEAPALRLAPGTPAHRAAAAVAAAVAREVER